jgi:helicase
MDAEKAVLDANSFKGFNPMQQAALKKNWKEKNLVVASPTASGKTIIAEIAALHSMLARKQKVIYTCPLRALAAEHYNDLKKKYSKQLGIRIALSTGDFDSSSRHLQNYDLIFTTYEKANSLIRHRAEWLGSVGLLIVDEIHELDSGRGPTLEVTVCQLLQMNPKMRVLALSATIPNAEELAEWLAAELVKSDYRPIPLYEGVMFGGKINYSGGREPDEVSSGNPLEALVGDTLFGKKKQAMVFANTRKNAEATAGKLSSLAQGALGGREKAALQKDSEKILNALETPTEQCRKLAELVARGAAFHHAGLLHEQRAIVEEAFKENRLKAIAATPTLAAGVNLPSHTVIIPSLYRFEAFGMSRIPVREIKQMLGRGGRPRFDTEGRGILIARSEPEADDLMEHYVKGEIEEVTSQLGIEVVLRMHLLSLIASHFIFDLRSMEEFFGRTLYARQYGDLAGLFGKIQEILRQLEEWRFIKSDEKRIAATPLGSRVSELYLDPETAHAMVGAFRPGKKFSPLGYLYLFAASSEFMPWLSVAKKKEPELWEQLQLVSRQLPVDLGREMYFDLNLLRKFNSALLLQDWAEEKQEQQLLKEFGTQPGILRRKLQVCDWLVYSALELAKLLKARQHFAPLSKLRKRLRHGVREELINLCEVRYVGRVRARRLWRANIRTIADLKRTDAKDLGRVLGEGIAAKVKGQLGQAKRSQR